MADQEAFVAKRIDSKQMSEFVEIIKDYMDQMRPFIRKRKKKFSLKRKING